MKAAMLTAALLGTGTSIAGAQLGELHFGVIAGYGGAESRGAGGGFAFAVVPGRLSYLGLRYVHSVGGTVQREYNGRDWDVQTRSQLIAVDLGFQVPAGGMELVIGSSLGATAFWQELTATTGSPQVANAWEFTVAPTATLFIRAGRLLIAPEFQWILAGNPDFEYPDPALLDFKPHVSHSGAQLNLRVVLPFEIDRIRH